ncbi:MAG: hypothetical protein Q9182_000601 [Xanthomendoza sp. 2 TL-2023]
MSRVMDTPKDRITRRDHISPPHTDTLYRRSGSDRVAAEEYIQVPRSTPDTVPAAEVKDKDNSERSPDSFMAPLPKAHSGGTPKSLPETILATQELPQRSQQDHPRKIMKLSGDWAALLENKAAKTPIDRRVDVDADQVHCQCNFFGEEGEMVQCSYCHTWQHTHCYGYISVAIPGEHACYRCLFEDFDTPRLEKLEDFARTRRSLWMLFGQEPPSSQSELKRRLDLQDGNAAAQLVRRLKEEGFLQPVRGTKLVRSISATQAGKRHQIYVRKPRKLGRLLWKRISKQPSVLGDWVWTRKAGGPGCYPQAGNVGKNGEKGGKVEGWKGGTCQEPSTGTE